jgi:hypothetical protein
MRSSVPRKPTSMLVGERGWKGKGDHEWLIYLF